MHYTPACPLINTERASARRGNHAEKPAQAHNTFLRIPMLTVAQAASGKPREEQENGLGAEAPGQKNNNNAAGMREAPQAK